MPYKKKSNHRHRIIGIIILSVTVLAIAAASLLAWFAYRQDQERRAQMIEDAKPRIVVPEGHFTTMEYHPGAVKSVRAVQLMPGTDFYTDASAGEEAVAAEIQAAVKQIADFGMNAVIVDTRMGDSVIFESSLLKSTGVDALKLICKAAADNGLNVGVIYHLSGLSDAEGAPVAAHYDPAARELLMNGLKELAIGYELESVALEGFFVERGGESYAAYVSYGPVGSYDDWMTAMVETTVGTLADASHSVKNSLPVGLNVPSVWANAEAKEGGSETKATFQALKDGHADTKGMVENKTVDFVNVDIPTSTENADVSFSKVVSWWNGVCKGAGVGFYVTHAAENAGNAELPGWNGTTELARQAVDVKNADGCYGSVFTGLSALVANPGKSTDSLLQYYEGAYSEQDLDQDLEITSPTKWKFQTYEEQVQFRMKFDPNQEVTLNGEPVVPTERGGSSVWINLQIGQNTIKLVHKGKTYTYQIERLVHIFKDYSPQGEMTVAGGSQIEVNAMAYKGSKLSATLNGQTIALEVGGAGEENDAESIYVNYRGVFTAPAATGEEQNIGKISIYGKYGPYDDGRSSGSITVAKLPDAVDPDEATGQSLPMVTVGESYAYTYPYLTTPGYPQSLLYQLPYGTQDIVVSQSGDFLNLRSGKTIKASSGSVTEEAFPGNNLISEFSVSQEGSDTVLRATMLWKAPFSVTPSPYPTDTGALTSSYQFAANTVTVTLDYATTMPETISGDISSSPLFSGISMERVKNEELGIWQYVITLPLRSTGVYMGCHATYEGNTLVLRFNNPNSSGSLSGVRICVDAGHGGTDPGNTAGANTYEAPLNLQMAQKLAEALRNLGAEVIMTRNDNTTMDLLPRVRVATDNYCDLLISVHHNSGGSNSSVNGIVTYYNTPFSQPLASYVQAQVGQNLKNNGIHGPDPQYNFVLTREKQFPSILVEYGFLSNPSDESICMDENHQWLQAQATAQGVLNYFNAMR